MLRRTVPAILLALTSAACAARGGGVPRPFPGAAPPPTRAAGTTPVAPDALPLITSALSYRGVPYRNGGSDPSGFDCSGFVQWVFAQQGRALPREVRDQFQLGEKIDRDEVRAGDLVFFETVSRGASHVGIALGGRQFVHAPSSQGVVRVESYEIDYWRRRFVGARRLE